MATSAIRTSQSDEGYKALRRDILAGRLKPGDPLKERELCARLGISRTPIREALRRLVAEGLAEQRPRRSIVVSQYDEEELREIFELGSVLESHVAGLAAQKAGPGDIAALEKLIVQMEKLLSGKKAAPVADYARLDQAFHDAIAKAARNSRIAQILRQTVSLRLLSNVMKDYAPADFAASLDQHRAIAASIANGDAEAACAAMACHVGSSRRTSLGGD